MNWLTPNPRRLLRCILSLLLCVSFRVGVNATPVELYSTQFEAAEGYDTGFTLLGQNQWLGEGDGGNGISEILTGFGQSAYIGFDPPTTNGLALWRPINYNPTNLPVVTVSLDFSIFDSSNTNRRDEFRWSVYNVQGQRLFCLIFDNYDLGIYYQLDTGLDQWTGQFFDNVSIFTLQIQMDFSANRWNAWLGTNQLIFNQNITTTNASLTFGDVDAVWLLRPYLNPVAGDNFMVFDNLEITADATVIPSSTVHPPLMVEGGLRLIRVDGSEGEKYAVEASTNLVQWTALKTNVVSDGYFDFLDTTAAGLPQRFYRARWVLSP